METQNKSPEVRFEGFTVEWEEKVLGDYGKVSMNKRIFKSQTSNEGEIPFYKIGTFGKQPDAFIKRELFEEYKKLYPYPNVGDILISASGSIGRTVVYKGEEEYFQDSNIVWLEHEGSLDNSFLKQYYSIIKWYGLEGSTIQRLYNKNILETNVFIPQLPEQKKIGNLFSNLDKLIKNHQTQLTKLKNLKKAMLTKMFPQKGASVPEIRFKGFDGEWGEIKLGKTKTFFTDGNYGEAYPKPNDLTDGSGVPFLRGSNLSNGMLSKDGANFIKMKKHLELTSGHLEIDDIVIAVRGSLGALGYVNKKNEGWNINSQLAIIRTDKNEILGSFLLQYLLSDFGQRVLLSKSTGTALKQLPIGNLKDIDIPFTDIAEQKKIGSYFKNLDDLIENHKEQFNKLNNIKKACLNKLFVS